MQVRSIALGDVFCYKEMRGKDFSTEVEVKLRVPDSAALLRRLRQLGAREIFPRTRESNTLYDTPKKDLARHRQLIRIRTERRTSDAPRKKILLPHRTILTLKGPLDSPGGPRAGFERLYKARQEFEIAVAGPEQVERVLVALGLSPVFRYEKIRTTWALPGIGNLRVEFDETPIGTFLELEGTPPAIDRAARLLGYARRDYITRTYGSLYLADCRRRNRRPGDMLFRPTKKLR